MFNPSQPIQFYRSDLVVAFPRIWICEWQTIAPAPAQTGVFIVEAGHYLGAKQTAKKTLRDVLVRSRAFIFEIRPPGLLERIQLKTMLCLEDGKKFATESPETFQAKIEGRYFPSKT